MDNSNPDNETSHSSPQVDSTLPPPNPVSVFPQSTLTRLPSTSDLSIRSSEDLIQAPDAASALAGTYSPDLDEMDSSGAQGHRRRRSAQMNSLETKRTSRGKRKSSRSAASEGSDMLSPGRPLREDRKKDSEGESDDDRSISDHVGLEDLSEEEGLQDDEETGLTGKDRGKRKRRKERSTLVDERIAGAPQITAEEKKEADQYVVKNMLINGMLIGLWYLFSLSISIYNKWMFSADHLDFHFPLFTTCGHMLVQFTLASLVLFFLPQFRPRYDSISNPHNTSHISDDDQALHETESKKPLMTKMFYFTRIGPCGMATGLDIGLGNMSLKFITLTFYTMCKSSSLAFVLLFAFLFRLEPPSLRLCGIIATMTVGVIMMVAGEVSFSVIGFILVISAAFFSGFRWGLTQILLLRNPATSNPFSSIFYLAPIMFVSLFVIAVPVEGFPALWKGLGVLIDKKGPVMGPLILLFPGVIAFLMTSSEFALLQRTSVVTLSIAGIFKEVVTISAAGIVFGDHLTPINISGLFVTIGAIAAYNWIKIKKMREDAQAEAHRHHALAQDSDSDSDSGDSEDWNTVEGTYVTADGDIMPNPASFKTKKGQSSKSQKRVHSLVASVAGEPVGPSRDEVLALAASKRELSD